jgi:hypothetical protein
MKREIRSHFEGRGFSAISKTKLHDVVLIKSGQGWLRKALQANPRSLFVSHFLNLSFESLGRSLAFLKGVPSEEGETQRDPSKKQCKTRGCPLRDTMMNCD